MSLIQKYNIPGPRYTSYPSVPYWDADSFHYTSWLESCKTSFKQSNTNLGISLYIHLPFSESLCTFCGCHKYITTQHNKEIPYINALLKEWQLYCDILPEKPIIKEIHLGGGTPTFFSAEHLVYLIKEIFKTATKAIDYEFSFEGHPVNTTKEHLQKLYDIGFKRVSFGVQDYDPKIQSAIHRKQNFHDVAKVTLWAKEIGYTSISHDLIYGLPLQAKNNIVDTVEKTYSLLPDRIAFYSYAHVPWVKGNGQRGFDIQDIPKGMQKQQLYELGKDLLIKNGYMEIGMDHFALKTDPLYKALCKGELHRNFMGYTLQSTQLMIGLGVSAISDSWFGFAQNTKDLKQYYALLENNVLPVVKGHILNQEDLIIREHILNLMCNLETDLTKDACHIKVNTILENLQELIQDDLVKVEQHKISVTQKGRPFIRNICMAFDLRLQEQKPDRQLFSMTI
ncbi:oxygen-independent coproporphyrinogen III oxidase [Myroides sp. LJL115]